MNYDEFKNELQEEIQANFLENIDFMSHIVTKTNETLDALTLKFAGQDVACTIYPEQMYKDYLNGASISDIADGVSASMKTSHYTKMPEITQENAEKSISLSLINIEKNKQLLKDCPHKVIHDMAAVPRWHVSDEASFLVTDKVMQALKMTKEEILDIAQKNTESAEYTCESLNEVMREVMVEEGIEEESLDGLIPTVEPPFYIVTNQNRMDGSCAILSGKFMQQAAEQIGSEEIYLLPASRHEMIAVNPNVVTDTSDLKDLVMSVNANPDVLRPEDYLSDSIYKYDARAHSISVCDNRGLFHDNPTVSKKDSIKPPSRGRG